MQVWGAANFLATALLVVLFAAGSATAQETTPKEPRKDIYGDALPSQALARLGSYRFQLAGKCVSDAAFSPDGKTLAIIALKSRALPVPLPPSTVRFWDSASGVDVGGFECPCTTNIAFAPDGKSVVTIYLKTLVFWDKAGTKLFELTSPGEIGCFTVSHDAKTLAVGEYVTKGTGGNINLFDLATKKLVASLKGHKQTVATMAFSADDKQLVSLSYYRPGSEERKPILGEMIVWDLAKSRLVRKTRHDGWPAALSHDGQRAAFAEPESGVRVVDTRTGQVLWRMSEASGSLHFSPNDRLLAVGGSYRTLLLDAATGKELRQLRGNIGALVDFSQDSELVLSLPSWWAAWTREQVRIWDVKSGKLRTPLPAHADTVDQVAVSPDGKTIASAGKDGTLRLWDSETGRARDVFDVELATVGPGFTALVFSPDGNHVAASGWDQTIRIISRAKRTQVSFDAGSMIATGGLAFTADGEYLLAATSSGAFQKWPVGAGRRSARYVFPANDRFWLGPFSADGRTVFMGAGHRMSPGIIWPTPTPERFWQVASGRALASVDWQRDEESGRSSLSAAALSADGRLLATVDRIDRGPTDPRDQKLRLWEMATGKEVLSLAAADLRINCLAFSPDGRWLASGHGEGFRNVGLVTDDYKSHILLWDTTTGKQVGELRGHRAPVACLAFSPRGDRLVSGSADNTVLIWDIQTAIAADSTQVAGLGERDLSSLWKDLASDDAALAYRAVCRLSSSPEQAVPFLRAHLRPADYVTRTRIKQATREIHSEVFTVRQQATRSLDAWGISAEESVEEALRDAATLESRTRLEALLSRLRQPPRAAELQQLRGLAVLLRINNPEALALVQILATGAPDARLTQEAQASRERKRPEKNTGKRTGSQRAMLGTSDGMAR